MDEALPVCICNFAVGNVVIGLFALQLITWFYVPESDGYLSKQN